MGEGQVLLGPGHDLPRPPGKTLRRATARNQGDGDEVLQRRERHGVARACTHYPAGTPAGCRVEYCGVRRSAVLTPSCRLPVAFLSPSCSRPVVSWLGST